MQTATHQAKAAVEGARDEVRGYLAELTDIQAKLVQAKKDHATPDRAEIEALEARLKHIQQAMSNSVEGASKEVAQVTPVEIGEASLLHVARAQTSSTVHMNDSFGAACQCCFLAASAHDSTFWLNVGFS